MLAKTKDPAGIVYPAKSVSCLAVCGAENPARKETQFMMKLCFKLNQSEVECGSGVHLNKVQCIFFCQSALKLFRKNNVWMWLP